MMFLHETDDPVLKKDMGSRAVLNTDAASLSRYRAERKRLSEMSKVTERMDSLEDKLDKLNNTIGELIASLKR